MGGIGGGALNSQVVISDRPITKQGIDGIGTGGKGELENKLIPYKMIYWRGINIGDW